MAIFGYIYIFGTIMGWLILGGWEGYIVFFLSENIQRVNLLPML
jgi:hypothetical protein